MKTRMLATVDDNVSVGDNSDQAAGLVSRIMVSSEGESSDGKHTQPCSDVISNSRG